MKLVTSFVTLSCFYLLSLASITAQSNNLAFLTNGLVAYYPFNGNANDESVYGSHAKVYGATLAVDRFGNTNNCYWFDGAGSYLKTPPNSNLPRGDRTVSLWFKANTISQWPVLLGYGGDYNVAGPSSLFMYLRRENNLGIQTHYAGGDPRAVGIETSLNTTLLNSWHHWVVTLSASQVNFYWDGIKILSTNVYWPTTYTLNKELFIGVDISGQGDGPYVDENVKYFHGFMDDIRLYNRALSNDEIANLNALESPAMASLNISVRSVQVDMHVKPGKKYQLESAMTLPVWNAIGSPFTATNATISQIFDVSAMGRYWRLIEVP